VTESQLDPGWIDEELRAEFPYVFLRQLEVTVGGRRSTPATREHLRRLSDRFTGGRAVNMRQEPIPYAYRVFFRQIGIDPDESRTPIEEAARERMKAGGFLPRNRLYDALVIAIVETGVAVMAFDCDHVNGPLGLRLAGAGERLGGVGRPLSARQILLADQERSLAVLFGDRLEEAEPGPRTDQVLLVAVGVRGVPEVSVEEALWTASELVAEGS